MRLKRLYTKASLFGFMLAAMLITQPAQAWLERMVPKSESHTVTAVDRDIAFVIDGYVYDARTSCFMLTGDRLVFLSGRHGLDYRAKVYNLTGKDQCDLLLRGRYQPNMNQ